MNLIIKNLLKRSCLLLLILIIIKTNITAQSDESVKENITKPRTANINIIARADTDSIVLRWAPSTPGGWVIANNLGYIVEKAVIPQKKSKEDIIFKKLNKKPLKPLTINEWKANGSPDNMFAAIAVQALYGELFNPAPLNQNNLNALKNAAAELTNRYSFSLFCADNDAFTAEALGLRIVDNDIKENMIYAYRIYVAEQTNEYTFDTAYIVVDAKPFKTAIAPPNLHYESNDKSIKLFWDEIEQIGSGYYIYRSDDNGKTYKKLNKMPLITVTPRQAVKDAQPYYIDTTTQNYKIYKYKVRGITSFGELTEANEITAYSKDCTPPPAPYINNPEQVSQNKMKITWKMKNPPADLLGFIVSRSKNSIDGYRVITQKTLPKNTTEFIDDMGTEYEAYYVVASVDTAGNVSFSLPVLASRTDTAPPEIPKGLTGVIDTNGIVTLTWNKNTKSNILGYRVLQANDPTHVFIQKTGQVIHDTVFIDSISIQTLTRYVYYKIVAVNTKYKNSKPSSALAIKRPDIIAPSEIVFANVFVTDSSVQLKWYKSSSNDVAIQILFRKKQETNNWIAIDSLPPETSFYTDKNVKTNINYAYSIMVIDSAGLASEKSFSALARPYDTGKRKPVENLSAEYKQSKKNVTLHWNYTLPEKEKVWFVIYKDIGDGSFKEYKSINGSTFAFVDNNITEGNIKYGVVVMTSYGGESNMTTTTVTIEKIK